MLKEAKVAISVQQAVDDWKEHEGTVVAFSCNYQQTQSSRVVFRSIEWFGHMLGGCWWQLQ